MGGAGSRRRQPVTPIPQYSPGTGGISRPGTAVGAGGIGAAGAMNQNQQRELMVANQTIANLNNHIQALQRGGMGAGGMGPGGMGAGGMGAGGMPYGGYPMPGVNQPPMPYGGPPMFGANPQYSPPPSPTLPHFGGQPPYPYPSGHQPMLGGASYRDTDFASIAHIAGLNPADVALLHREFMNLTRGGSNKMDRTVFRQLLRDVLLEANSEHVDRVIESMFQTVDRNRDGFIDFPEFVGAFKDVLKGHVSSDVQDVFNESSSYHDILTQQLLATGVGSGVVSQPLAYIQQPQPAAQLVSGGGLSLVPLASTGVQQMPLVYGGGAAAASLPIMDAPAPLLTLDPNQSSYVIATPGQYLITQPTALQCAPLPMM